MKGYIQKKGNRYYASVEDSSDGAGKRHREALGGFATKREAQKAITETLARRDAGVIVRRTPQTLGQFVDEEWLPAVRGTLRPKTFASYQANLRLHVLPRLGHLGLQALTPGHLNGLYAVLGESGRRDGKGGLSARSVRYVATILGRVLKDAVRWGKLVRSPAELADPPRQTRPEMQAWTAEEARAFEAHVRDDRLHAAWLLLLTRGLRRGEVLGLRWSDVDLDGGRLAVRQALVEVNYELRFSEPKTAKGRRTVPLDAQLVGALRAHRRRQVEERLAWGGGYVDSGLVFTREDGSAVHPQSLSAAFDRHVRRAGLRRIRLHDLRHTCATLSLRSGIPTRVVSDWLGHATTSITDDLYRHVTPSMLEEAGAKLTDLILGTRPG